MLTGSAPPPKQVLLRLPDDVAARLARAVPPRKRNQFLIDLVRRELEKEDQALIEACDALNRMEAETPALRAEGGEWLAAPLTSPVEVWDLDFDAGTFSREAAKAQAALRRKSHTRPRRA